VSENLSSIFFNIFKHFRNYLNEHQLNVILQTPFFSLPMLESLVEYTIYHNRPNTPSYQKIPQVFKYFI
jgi:hypothetical protein